MARVDVDTSRFPLVVQTLRFGYTAQDLLTGLEVYKPLLATGKRYAIAVQHEPGAPVADAQIRAMLGEWQAKNDAAIKRCNVCVGVVLPSFAHRAAMTALNWLFPPVTPQRACASLIEAVDFCCERLTQEGIPLSPSILVFQAELKRQAGYGTG
jgi:hypothetical protein